MLQIPFSSVNKKLEEIVKSKKRLIVYNKSDLADPVVNLKLPQLFRSPKSGFDFPASWV